MCIMHKHALINGHWFEQISPKANKKPHNRAREIKKSIY